MRLLDRRSRLSAVLATLALTCGLAAVEPAAGDGIPAGDVPLQPRPHRLRTQGKGDQRRQRRDTGAEVDRAGERNHLRRGDRRQRSHLLGLVGRPRARHQPRNGRRRVDDQPRRGDQRRLHAAPPRRGEHRGRHDLEDRTCDGEGALHREAATAATTRSTRTPGTSSGPISSARPQTGTSCGAPPPSTRGASSSGVSSIGDCPLIPGEIVKLNAITGAVEAKFDTTPPGCPGGGPWTSPTIDTQTGTVYVNTGTDGGGYCGQEEPYAQAMLELNTNLELEGSWKPPPNEQVIDGDFGGDAHALHRHDRRGQTQARRRGEQEHHLLRARTRQHQLRAPSGRPNRSRA